MMNKRILSLLLTAALLLAAPVQATAEETDDGTADLKVTVYDGDTGERRHRP